MTETLRRQWIIWHVLLALYLISLSAAHVAGLKRVTVLTLQPHVEVELNVFSLLGHDIYLDLEFSRFAAKGNDDGQRTLELGGIRYRPGQGGSMILPGQPVVVDVAINDGPFKRLSAAPGVRAGSSVVVRSLRSDVALVPARYGVEPRDETAKLTARPGLNRLTIQVVQVGSSLRGEDIELIAQPPLQVRALQPGYGIFVYPFWILPFALVGFIGWGMVLFMRAARQADD